MKKKIKGILNLNYIEVQNVPIAENKRFGEGVRADVLKDIEILAARAILEKKLPIRGMEVHFFRTALAMSQRQLAKHLGYSDVAILKWERAKSKRLSPVNEVAFRAFMAGRFGIKIEGTFEALLGSGKTPTKLILTYKAMEKIAEAA